MERLLARYQEDGADFLDGVPKELLPDLYYLGDLEGQAVYGFFAASKFFIVDAPGGQALVPFLSSRLRQLGRELVAPTGILLTSCGPAETSGLNELIEKWHPLVVVSPEGLEHIADLCVPGTAVLPAPELPAKGWFDVKPIPLTGRGLAPSGYKLTWAGKTVLFAGRIPVKINQESAQKLAYDLTNGQGNVRGYFASITDLGRLKPDVWLPSVPEDGQNANLYDSDWQRTIEEHLLVIRLILERSTRDSTSSPAKAKLPWN
jgi:hypothetical protein